MSIYRLEALFQESKQMSNPEQQGEMQKCQQEAPSDTKVTPGGSHRQRQVPNKRQPGATVGHRLTALGHRLTALGHRRAVAGRIAHCLMSSAWR